MIVSSLKSIKVFQYILNREVFDWDEEQMG